MDDIGTNKISNRRRHSSAETITVKKTVNVRLSVQDSQFRSATESSLVKGVLFHQDNAPNHKSVTAMAAIHDFGFYLIEHPPYSPDLAPSDFHLFSKLKAAISGTHFQSDDDVIFAVDGFLTSQDKEFFKSANQINRYNSQVGNCHVIKQYIKRAFAELSAIPNIAVIGSGGGVRAMTGMSSVFCTLHDLDLLQYILYVVGLSGSAWYLTTLYSHKKWPLVHPKKIHTEIKEKVLNDLFNTLNEILKAPRTWLSSLILQHKPMNITQLFGLSLGSNLMPDRFTTRWSYQRDKIKDGRVPFPLLACIHAKSDTPAKDYHEWVEISPFEVAIPKYGIGMDTVLFGSVFDKGNLIKRMEELPLYYINGIIGSAFTIINEELALLRKDEKRHNNDVETDGVPDEVTRPMDDDDLESLEYREDMDKTNRAEDSKDVFTDLYADTNGHCMAVKEKKLEVSVLTQNIVDEQRIRRIQKECPFWLKDFMSETLSNHANQSSNEENDFEIDGIMDDALGYIKSLKIFERADRNQPMCFVDAGFAFNSPYPLVLRAPRSVDLILSFDFTDRGSVHGDPFKEVRLAKTWADLHKVKFPPVPVFDKRQGVKELYILEDEDDPLCPVIMHFVLMNRDFKLFSSPGHLRQTADEVKFANFDLFQNDSCPYNSQNFKLTNLQFERLSELVRFNILNNKEKILEQMQRAAERQANAMQ
ncbi:hypothetical protein FSP39_018221 [Pinctada imbricata]|uniref:PLA2c domain-containing protein n=1 Tax=Pinctada imbricata TaxID=66713 RepID=A0AA89BV80_PINIB|nr:hypothetical protein FSP39_018221 [Pinctada imbricata]